MTVQSVHAGGESSTPMKRNDSFLPAVTIKGPSWIVRFGLNLLTCRLTSYSEISLIDASTPSNMKCPAAKYLIAVCQDAGNSGCPEMTPIFRTQMISVPLLIFGPLKKQSSEKIL